MLRCNSSDMPAVNRDALEDVLLRVSEMAGELPQIIEMDINPLLVSAQPVLSLKCNIFQ